MNKYILAILLMASSLAHSATVELEAGYLHQVDVPAGVYSFVFNDEVIGTGPIALVMNATLFNQGPGNYTAHINVCNAAACSSKSVSYSIPDAPNVDDITITVTISRDE